MDKEVFKTCFKDIKIIRFHKNILKRKILSEANKCFLSIKSSFVIVKKKSINPGRRYQIKRNLTVFLF